MSFSRQSVNFKPNINFLKLTYGKRKKRYASRLKTQIEYLQTLIGDLKDRLYGATKDSSTVANFRETNEQLLDGLARVSTIADPQLQQELEDARESEGRFRAMNEKLHKHLNEKVDQNERDLRADLEEQHNQEIVRLKKTISELHEQNEKLEDDVMRLVSAEEDNDRLRGMIDNLVRANKELQKEQDTFQVTDQLTCRNFSQSHKKLSRRYSEHKTKH